MFLGLSVEELNFTNFINLVWNIYSRELDWPWPLVGFPVRGKTKTALKKHVKIAIYSKENMSMSLILFQNKVGKINYDEIIIT